MRPAQTKVLYALYGVVSHSGDLGGGHYVAYVRTRAEQKHVRDFFQQAAHESLADASRLGDLLLHLGAKQELNGSLGAAVQTPTEAEAEQAVQQLKKGSRWFLCSDSRVSASTEATVLACEAYLLFYERIF